MQRLFAERKTESWLIIKVDVEAVIRKRPSADPGNMCWEHTPTPSHMFRFGSYYFPAVAKALERSYNNIWYLESVLAWQTAACSSEIHMTSIHINETLKDQVNWRDDGRTNSLVCYMCDFQSGLKLISSGSVLANTHATLVLKKALEDEAQNVL